jgi:SAM-dependent methyltransferase
MARYALLVLPSANRVYAQASPTLACAELEIFNRAVLGGRLSGIGEMLIAGVPYVGFSCDSLSDRDTAFLANLSCGYALFAADQADGGLLRPVPLRGLDRFDDDLLTIQKYQGKTNEQFTKLLLNVGLLSSAFGPAMGERQFSVLDPLCGRGSTLNQALMYGFDAAGVDIDGQDFEAYSAFIRTWLQRKRIKHHADVVPVRRDRRIAARRLRVSLAAAKDDYLAGRTQQLDVVHADTAKVTEFFRPASFDLVITDAPYGVRHGSRGASGKLARNPLDLLAAAAPGWASVLRPGGALAMSWNTLVARREDAAAVLEQAGLRVLSDGPYLALKHRVDQAIVRDVLAARKP